MLGDGAALRQTSFAMIEIDSVRVKGKRDAATVYTLLGGPDLLRQNHFRAFRGAFLEMREHYSAAATGRRRALALDTKPAATMRSRS